MNLGQRDKPRPFGIVEGISARIGIFTIHKDFPSSRCPHDTDSIPIGRFARFIRQFVPKQCSVHHVKGIASMFPWKPDHVALKKLLNFHDVIYGPMSIPLRAGVRNINI